jgi:endoglucanase
LDWIGVFDSATTGNEASVRWILLFTVVLVACASLAFSKAGKKLPDDGRGPLQLIGINIAGGEFAEGKLPGEYGHDYSYPDSATIKYFASKRMNIIRVPMRWERLQRRLGADLDEQEMLRVDAVVADAHSKGMRVLLDVHNYAIYYGSVIGSQKLPTSALGNLWGRIARRYKNKDWVIFGLMNEPKDLQSETWLEAVNIAISEIRQTGASNMIFVPGNGWSSARTWVTGHYGTPNAQIMLNVSDPDDNFAYEVHQYFNADFTGTTADCQDVNVGVEALTPFTQWARSHRKRGFLGEFGAGRGQVCLSTLDHVLRFLTQNSDVWLGWAYWAAGTWWSEDYFTSVQPLRGKDRPQIAVLEKYTKPLQNSQ